MIKPTAKLRRAVATAKKRMQKTGLSQVVNMQSDFTFEVYPKREPRKYGETILTVSPIVSGTDKGPVKMHLRQACLLLREMLLFCSDEMLSERAENLLKEIYEERKSMKKKPNSPDELPIAYCLDAGRLRAVRLVSRAERYATIINDGHRQKIAVELVKDDPCELVRTLIEQNEQQIESLRRKLTRLEKETKEIKPYVAESWRVKGILNQNLFDREKAAREWTPPKDLLL